MELIHERVDSAGDMGVALMEGQEKQGFLWRYDAETGCYLRCEKPGMPYIRLTDKRARRMMWDDILNRVVSNSNYGREEDITWIEKEAAVAAAFEWLRLSVAESTQERCHE